MLNDKTKQRYLDYLLTYVNTIEESGADLQIKCKKKRSGDTIVKGKKYAYFALPNGITLINRKNNLEITFSFNTLEDSIYFGKEKLHNFIESDLNASGLGKDISNNKTVRLKEYDEFLEGLVYSGMIEVYNNGYIISKDELY